MTIEPPETSATGQPLGDGGDGKIIDRGLTLVLAGAIVLATVNLGRGLSDSVKTDFGVEVVASLALYLIIAMLVGLRRLGQRLRDVVRRLLFGDLQSFPPSPIMSSAYRRAFVKHWRKATSYDYRGATAFFSAFRIFELSQRKLALPASIRLAILDPNAHQTIDDTAYLLGKTADQLRNECYMAISALHDADHPAIEVYLINEPVGDRCELLGDALFLTYYQGEERFDATELFHGHMWAYAHYGNDLARSRARATRTIRFGRRAAPADRVSGEVQLAGLLAQLGCTSPLPDLRILRDSHFRALRREVDLLPERERGYF